MLFLNSRYKPCFASFISTVILQELKYTLFILILRATSPVMLSAKEVLKRLLYFKKIFFLTSHTIISSWFSLQSFSLSSVLMYSFLSSYLLPLMCTVGLLCPSLDDSSYKHFMIFAIHIKVLLSPFGFINVLDCVQAKRIHVGQGSEGKHLQTITDEYTFQTIGQTGEGEWLWLLRASFPGTLLLQDEKSALHTDEDMDHGPALAWVSPGKKKGPPKK